MSCPAEFRELEQQARNGCLLTPVHVLRAVAELESIALETQALIDTEPTEELADRLSVLRGLIRFLKTQNPAQGGVPV